MREALARRVRQPHASRSSPLLYIFGRIAMDLVGALVILYMTHWIGRSEDFEPLMALFLLCVLAALPFWLQLAGRRDKVTVFVAGSLLWAAVSLLAARLRPRDAALGALRSGRRRRRSATRWSTSCRGRWSAR